jgi:hypothetical protein
MPKTGKLGVERTSDGGNIVSVKRKDGSRHWLILVTHRSNSGVLSVVTGFRLGTG